MDPEFIKYLGTLGVGGALAGMMFAMYRKDVKLYTDLWKGQSDRFMQIVESNTESHTKLILIVDALRRQLDREAKNYDERDARDRARPQ